MNWHQIRHPVIKLHDPRVVKYIGRQVKGSKNKLKVPCPNIIYEYKQYMGRVDLSDQMKSVPQIDRRSKFFYLRIFFNFLNFDEVNYDIIYDKMDHIVDMLVMDVHFRLAR